MSYAKVSFVEPSAQNLDRVRALLGCVAELFLAHLDESLAQAVGLLLAKGLWVHRVQCKNLISVQPLLPLSDCARVLLGGLGDETSHPSQVSFLARLETLKKLHFFSGAKRSYAGFAAKQSSLRAVVVDLLMVPWYRKKLSIFANSSRGIDEACPSSSPSNERFDRSFFGGIIDVKRTELCDADPEWNQESCVTLTQNGYV